MKPQLKGFCFSILAAVCYGVMPVVARFSYAGGANGFTLAVLRAFMGLPVLFVLLKLQKISLRLQAGELKYILLIALFSALTNITLYVSYSYIAVGIATTLHFVYPIFVALACVVFFKERLNRAKLVALVLASAGIALCMDLGGGGSLTGRCWRCFRA